VLSASTDEYSGPTKYHLCVFGEIVPVFDGESMHCRRALNVCSAWRQCVTVEHDRTFLISYRIQLCAYNELSTVRACAASQSGPVDGHVAGGGPWTAVCLDAHRRLLLGLPHHGRRMTTVVTLVSSALRQQCLRLSERFFH